MNESKVTFLVVLGVLLAVYQVRQWITGDVLVDCPEEVHNDVCLNQALRGLSAPPPALPLRRPNVPAVPLDVCTVLDVLTLRSVPPRRCRSSELRARLAAERQKDENPTASTVTIVMLLILSTFKNVHDVMRSRREAALRQEREPEEARRRSLAEFAERNERKACRFFPGKPTLMQLTEPFLASRGPHLARADSSNSYLTERMQAQESQPPRNSAADCTPPASAAAHEDRFKKIPVVKLFGGRPAPLLTRRSSVPAMPHPAHPAHPTHPALDQLRQQEPRRLSICDSEDEASAGDPRAARRVRLIRRR